MELKAFEGKSLKRGILLYLCIRTHSPEFTPESPVMFLLLSMAILLTFMFLFHSISELFTYSSISFSKYLEFRIFITHMFYCYIIIVSLITRDVHHHVYYSGYLQVVYKSPVVCCTTLVRKST